MSELGPIATKILYEDDEIRIWDQRLAPGEATAAHHHANEYALVDVDGDRVEVFPVEGEPNPHGTGRHYRAGHNRSPDRGLRLRRRRGVHVLVRDGAACLRSNAGFLLVRPQGT